MNAIFATQGLNLRFQYRLAEALRPKLPLEGCGFYVSDSHFQESFLREAARFANEPHVLAEWDILKEARRAQADVEWLRRREREMDVGPLWDALVCDRRMMQGRWCKERQDYRPRFSHDEFLRILTVALQHIERWLDAVAPSVHFGLVPVTFGEYLIWMAAAGRGVPSLFVYPTKIQNYMCWMDSFFGRPDVLVRAYQDYQDGERDLWIGKAETYVASVADGLVRHEGMVAIPSVVHQRHRMSIGEVLSGAGRLALAEYRYRAGAARDDNHVNPPIATLCRNRVGMAMRRCAVTRALSNHYVRQSDLGQLQFAFYPLHAEPEVALSIQGKPYLNQIETIRTLARNLPVGMVLLTKEHPRSIGYHPPGYYRKLLEIPNVRIVDPFVESRHVVANATFVATVWSLVGFEAILQHKPLLSLGTPPFTILPPRVVRHVTDLNRLHADIRALLDEYAPDDRAVVHYVAACMKSSFPLDFYAVQLQKEGRFKADAADARAQEGWDGFVRYTASRVRAVTARPVHA